VIPIGQSANSEKESVLTGISILNPDSDAHRGRRVGKKHRSSPVLSPSRFPTLPSLVLTGRRKCDRHPWDTFASTGETLLALFTYASAI
jgi:hypothetical protein